MVHFTAAVYRERRREAGVPESVGFRTKPQLAQLMLKRALESGVPFGWVAGDEVYGNDRKLRGWLEREGMSIFMVIRPAIFTDIQPPRERGELTIIRLWLAGQSPPLRPAERGVARAVPGSWRPR